MMTLKFSHAFGDIIEVEDGYFQGKWKVNGVQADVVNGKVWIEYTVEDTGTGLVRKMLSSDETAPVP